MKAKAILALLLVSALFLGLFAACGTSEPAAEDGGTTNTPGNINDTPGDEPDDEIVEIELWLMDTYGHGADHGDRIEAAINAIAEEKINVHVNIEFMSIGDFNSKTRTAIAGGERVDLMTYGGRLQRVNTMVTDTMAMDMTEYLNTYAPDALSLTEAYLPVYTYGGKIYGLPTLRNFVTGGWLFFNKDELDALNLTQQASEIDSFSDFEAVMAAIKQAHPDDGTYPLSCDLGATIPVAALANGDDFASLYITDVLNDQTETVATDSDGHVLLLPEQEGWIANCERVVEWVNNGWIFPDSTIDRDMRGQDSIKQRVAVCEISTSELGAETNRANIYGASCLPVKLYDGIIFTSTMQSWGIGCPITAEEPEAACKFLNLLYTSEDIMRLLVNGEEGVDYEIIDGQAQEFEGQFNAGNYIIGNNLLAWPIYGNGADFYSRVEEANNAAPLSTYYGFTLDVSELDLLISQLSAVKDQYRTTLLCGGFTEEVYKDYLNKLQAAGVDEYLQIVQQQLDAWLLEQ